MQATIETKEKDIVYMVMEPEHQPGPDGKFRIHILKAEYKKSEEGSTTDVLRHKFCKPKFSCGLFEAAHIKRH